MPWLPWVTYKNLLGNLVQVPYAIGETIIIVVIIIIIIIITTIITIIIAIIIIIIIIIINLDQVPYAIGETILGVFAFFIRDYVTLQWVVSATMLIQVQDTCSSCCSAGDEGIRN